MVVAKFSLVLRENRLSPFHSYLRDFGRETFRLHNYHLRRALSRSMCLIAYTWMKPQKVHHATDTPSHPNVAKRPVWHRRFTFAVASKFMFVSSLYVTRALFEALLSEQIPSNHTLGVFSTKGSLVPRRGLDSEDYQVKRCTAQRQAIDVTRRCARETIRVANSVDVDCTEQEVWLIFYLTSGLKGAKTSFSNLD